MEFNFKKIIFQDLFRTSLSMQMIVLKCIWIFMNWQTWWVVESEVSGKRQRGIHPVQLCGPSWHHGDRGVCTCFPILLHVIQITLFIFAFSINVMYVTKYLLCFLFRAVGFSRTSQGRMQRGSCWHQRTSQALI